MSQYLYQDAYEYAYTYLYSVQGFCADYHGTLWYAMVRHGIMAPAGASRSEVQKKTQAQAEDQMHSGT